MRRAERERSAGSRLGDLNSGPTVYEGVRNDHNCANLRAAGDLRECALEALKAIRDGDPRALVLASTVLLAVLDSPAARSGAA